jgi:uncharacterized protein
LQASLRWWDQWLKGIDTGIMDEPLYRVWMQDSVPPRAEYDERPGRWVAEPSWPSPTIEARDYALIPGRLTATSDAQASVDIPVRTPQFLGIAAGSWCGFGLNADAPWDQRADDGMSVCFETAPLPERLEILGAPMLTVHLSCDRPNGFLCARLCDVAPDGASLRVTYGLLNLTHHASHEHPGPLEPGRRYAARLQLNDAAHAFPAGHRIRLALSTTYWPIAWPSPEAATVTVSNGSRLLLPIRRARPVDAELRPFAESESAPPEARTTLRQGSFERSFAYDVATDTMTYTSTSDSGRQRIDAIGLELEEIARKIYRIGRDDPLSADNVIHWTTRRARGDWQVRVESRTHMRATREHFLIDAELDAYEDERRVFSRSWHTEIPRDLV